MHRAWLKRGRCAMPHWLALVTWVRLEADAARRRLSGTTSDTCKLERERLGRCSGLVVRGAELVKRGVELSERTAIDKDSVVQLVR